MSEPIDLAAIKQLIAIVQALREADSADQIHIEVAADASALLAEVERLKESLDLACRKLQTYGHACAENDRRIAVLTELLREVPHKRGWSCDDSSHECGPDCEYGCDPDCIRCRIDAVLEEPTT